VETVKLTLYLTGNTPRSVQAEEGLRRICEEEFTEGYELDIVDVLKQPDVAKTHHILATPTLVKEAPSPRRRVLGDLSNKKLLFMGLDMALDSSCGGEP